MAGSRITNLWTGLAGAAALLASPATFAETTPDAPQEPPAPAARVFAPTLIASTEFADREAVRVFVRDIRFIVRVGTIPEDQLKPLVADLVGRELAVEAIRRALGSIADRYAAQGQSVRVILPQQSFLDGIVRIVVAAPLPPLDAALPERSAAAPVAGSDDAASRRAAVAREQRLVADAIAARYRVARKEVESVVATAYQAGRESAVDPLLILAVIAVESSFDPAAVSAVGARGLMQVMPQFHMDKIAHHGDAEVLFDPRTNIRVGAKILREYLQRFGETVGALQMYVGAFNDPSFAYARRVLTERSIFQRLVARLRRAT